MYGADKDKFVRNRKCKNQASFQESALIVYAIFDNTIITLLNINKKISS